MINRDRTDVRLLEQEYNQGRDSPSIDYKRARTADLLHAMNHQHVHSRTTRCANCANTNSRELSLTQADAR